MMPEKRKSAFLRATQEAQTVVPLQESNAAIPASSETAIPLSSHAAITQQGETAKQQSSEAVAPIYSEEAKLQSGITAKKQEKATFYLTSEQIRKLDRLAYEHLESTGRRINRNDIVRLLIDQCSLDSLQGL